MFQCLILLREIHIIFRQTVGHHKTYPSERYLECLTGGYSLGMHLHIIALLMCIHLFNKVILQKVDLEQMKHSVVQFCFYYVTTPSTCNDDDRPVDDVENSEKNWNNNVSNTINLRTMRFFE